MDTLTPCNHHPVQVSGLTVVACAGCRNVEWRSGGRPLDPTEAMARVFGNFDLVGLLPALRAPAITVFVYRAPGRRQRAALQAFPPGAWLQIDDSLWLCHDGENLLLAPTDPLLARNLAARSQRQAR